MTPRKPPSSTKKTRATSHQSRSRRRWPSLPLAQERTLLKALRDYEMAKKDYEITAARFNDMVARTGKTSKAAERKLETLKKKALGLLERAETSFRAYGMTLQYKK